MVDMDVEVPIRGPSRRDGFIVTKLHYYRTEIFLLLLIKSIQSCAIGLVKFLGHCWLVLLALIQRSHFLCLIWRSLLILVRYMITIS
jgi:hypothetical protein